MIEPVALQDLQVAFFAAAAVIVFGAGYAGLYAWARVTAKPGLMVCAYGCYALLAAAVFLLAQAAHLSGTWNAVTALMLAGYLLAPRGIWRLCTASHPAAHSRESGR